MIFNKPTPHIVIKPRKNVVHRSSPINPKCIDCKYYVNEKCKLFGYSFVAINDNEYINDYIEAIEARHNIELCGIDAKYFKPK
jgi:hypothetical protein